MTILVTGANRGIGYELCQQLKEMNETVIAVCRSSSSELDDLKVQVESGIDISSDASVANLVQRLQGGTIAVLINNAGMFQQTTLEDLNFDSIRQQFEVNAMGALRVTEALLPNLKAGSKIAMITSRMGSIADNTSGGYYGYRMSKAALSMAGKSLAIDLKPRQIAVAILHPGMVSTDMTNHSGIPVAESVQGILQRIEQLNLQNSGTFWHANGEELPW
ncbi:MAG: SDR family oxidoreductase [Stenomitos rutilans HA7619-LM2]|jgi:NAD(P)-dependent dehydrogenase (short-subunit alcohol dehydrogenase family)|nr:SDR family oxidoreductase [Stenomitos rutilans HA7619-LM2]